MSQPLPPDFSPFGPMRDEPVYPVASRPKRRLPGFIKALLILALILSAGVLLNETVLRIRRVAVIGNQRISWDTVVEAAGFKRNVSYLTVREDKVAAGVNANRYLVFVKMEKQFPDSVILYVRERSPQANVQVMGVTYQMDEEGMILERLGNVPPDGQLMTITGLQNREIRVGSFLSASMASQMNAYTALVQEVILQGFAPEVSELNLSNPESLYLMTRDGYTAHLGDDTELRAKVGTVRAVVNKLREMGKTGGMLEASVPGVATYMPMDGPES